MVAAGRKKEYVFGAQKRRQIKARAQFVLKLVRSRGVRLCGAFSPTFA